MMYEVNKEKGLGIISNITVKDFIMTVMIMTIIKMETTQKLVVGRGASYIAQSNDIYLYKLNIVTV